MKRQSKNLSSKGIMETGDSFLLSGQVVCEAEVTNHIRAEIMLRCTKTLFLPYLKQNNH
jgi:hypothetical protein